MEFAKIVLFSTGAAIAYGIVHDQVTAHLCPEYFTVAHPPVFQTDSPFLLAIGWGIIATWWVGLPLGIALGAAARVGPPPRFSLADLRPMIFRLLAIVALCAIAAAVLGGYLVATGVAAVPGGWAAVIPVSKWVAFSADAWAHLASYVAGTVGGLVLICYVLWRRTRQW
jgi:hypothetical protein